MSPSISSTDAQNGSAAPSHTHKLDIDSSSVRDLPQNNRDMEQSSVLKTLSPPSIRQAHNISEPLERFLKDSTVLVPKFGRAYNSSEHSGEAKVDTSAHKQAILDEENA